MTAFAFEAQMWRWEAQQSAWFFVTLPEDVSDEIEDAQTEPRRGFGAVKVRVTVGSTTWTTSVFPSQEHKGYILPVKAVVRAKENLTPGSLVAFHLELV